jgi:hypothetical protein
MILTKEGAGRSRIMIMNAKRALLYAVTPLIGLTMAGCTVYEEPPPNTVTVVPNSAPPPPPPQVEVIGVAPYPGAIWCGGHYAWQPRGWVWVGGYWRRPPYTGAVYVRGYYHHGPRGYVWVGGYWR